MIDRGPLSCALSAGDIEQVKTLVAAGENLHYRDDNGYDALVDAVHGRDVTTDARLLGLLEYLIAQGVALDGETKYRESGLSVLSHLGRFDAVAMLLRAGAPRALLQWTPLMEAVALGTLAEVEALSRDAADLEAVDRWSRTAWLIAVARGDIDRAQLMRERGANTDACARCAQPALALAVRSRNPDMVAWLLAQGKDVNQQDQFGDGALHEAAQLGELESLQKLLRAGAMVEGGRSPGDVLRYAGSREVIVALLAAGADIQHLSFEGRRMLLGLPGQPSSALLEVSRAQFERGRSPRFGVSNPERIHEPYWEQMIRAGVTAYSAEVAMGETPRCDKATPGWCAQRFGQSLTFLPDGRIVQVAGEHEDSYDPDFCIYNDVFVHGPGGAIEIYGYPEAEFPPTDFHAATLIGPLIYLVGSLGYRRARRFGETQVYRLDTNTWRMEAVETHGDRPGWIYKHRAIALSGHEIRIEGGTVVTIVEGAERHDENGAAFVLDVEARRWRRIA